MARRTRHVLAFRALALTAGILAASSRAGAAPPVAVDAIPARPGDVSTIDAIVKAYYEVISGPAGQPREWSRDRTLYPPHVRFVEITEGKDGNLRAKTMTHQEYVDGSDADFLKKGFDEHEIHRVTERFGSIANVFSTYEEPEETRRAGDRARHKQPAALSRRRAVVDRLVGVAGREPGASDPENLPAGLTAKHPAGFRHSRRAHREQEISGRELFFS